MAEERATFESLMQQLETLVGKLESNDLALEDAIDAYQRGVALAREGQRRLDDAERRIEEVTKGGQTRPLEADAILERQT